MICSSIEFLALFYAGSPLGNGCLLASWLKVAPKIRLLRRRPMESDWLPSNKRGHH